MLAYSLQYLKMAANDSDDTPPSSTVQESPSTDWVKSDSASISGQLERLQEKQRAAVERAKSRGKDARPHPDLEDLSLDYDLPPPIKPTTLGVAESKDHGSLSDYSDYDSSADEAPRASGSTNTPSSRFDYKSHRMSDVDDYAGGDTQRNLLDDDDPFADPFADQSDVGTPGIPEKGQPRW
jgi:hypothetical protein